MSKNKLFLLIPLGIIFLLGGFYWVYNKSSQTTNDYSSFSYQQFPLLDIPIRYFSKDDAQWGSVKENSVGETMDGYYQVALYNKAVYQSYPTTDVSIEDYANEIKPLRTQTAAQIKAIYDLPDNLN